MDITTHTPGSFCTTVLRTGDLERAAALYSALVGWTSQEVSGTPGHRLLQFGGRTVASLHQSSNGSDVWVPHVSVESIERTTAEALALRAMLVDTASVPGIARLATLRDPEGALFGLWQPAPHQGAQLTEDVGSLWWIEVLSNNVAGAREFYGRLFGWTSVDTSFEPFASYTVFKRGDVQEGGILPIGRRLGSIANVELDLRGGRLQRHDRAREDALRLLDIRPHRAEARADRQPARSGRRCVRDPRAGTLITSSPTR